MVSLPQSNCPPPMAASYWSTAGGQPQQTGRLRLFHLRKPFQSTLTLASAKGTQPWSQTLPIMNYHPEPQLSQFWEVS